jgi:hypothetical protein
MRLPANCSVLDPVRPEHLADSALYFWQCADSTLDTRTSAPDPGQEAGVSNQFGVMRAFFAEILEVRDVGPDNKLLSPPRRSHHGGPGRQAAGAG